MVCEHKRIKSVNCVLFCDICGEKLPDDYLMNKPEKAAETPKEPQETPKKRTTRKKA